MSDIPSQILSDHLADRLSGKKVLSAVFLTYRFDPGFFESEVLPTLFEGVGAQAAVLRLLRLEQPLSRIAGRVAVYYDHRGLEASEKSATLDVQRIPIVHSNGVFHPKLVLLLCEEAADNDELPEQVLLVGCLSANLTRAGWWENLEVCHFEQIHTDDSTRMREDLLKLAATLRRRTADGTDHAALNAIADFLRDDTGQKLQRKSGGVLHTHLYVSGGESVVEFLRSAMGRALDRCYLEVISPYFDKYAKKLPLDELIGAFAPVETRVHLPLDDAGRAGVSESVYRHVAELSDTCWGQLPNQLLRLGAAADAGNRFVHAKVYRFFKPASSAGKRIEVLFVGSVNLTSAAHTGTNNFEIGMLVQNESLSRNPEFWLKADTRKPAEFQHQEETGESTTQQGVPLLVRFSWKDTTARVWWEGRESSPALRLEANGVELASLPVLPPREWRPLESSQAAALREVLLHTSFLTVHGYRQEPTLLLVQEEGMANKPSLLITLSARDILEYWALLTEEQKTHFLERRLPEALLLSGGDELRVRQDLGELPDSMFDRFAGIFHAFSCVESVIIEQLDKGNTREAEYRLFGCKMDSVGELIDRVLDSPEAWDDVHRYVVLLCARQLCEQVRAHDAGAELWATHRVEARALQARLDRVAELRARLELRDPEGMHKFLGWFEPWFLRRAAHVEVAK